MESKDQEEAEESGSDEKDKKQRQLDKAIQNAKIDKDEIDHGIVRPHEMDLKEIKNRSNKDSCAETSQTSTKLGKRPLGDITNTES